MTTKTELALIALTDVLDVAFGKPFGLKLRRNEALDDILDTFGDGIADGAGYANLVDGQGEVLNQMAGAATEPGIEGYEIEHRAGLELFFTHADQDKRDATMDSIIETAAAAIEADRTLGGVVTFTEFEAPARENFKQEGLPVIKNVTFTVVLTFVSSRPF